MSSPCRGSLYIFGSVIVCRTSPNHRRSLYQNPYGGLLDDTLVGSGILRQSLGLPERISIFLLMLKIQVFLFSESESFLRVFRHSPYCFLASYFGTQRMATRCCRTSVTSYKHRHIGPWRKFLPNHFAIPLHAASSYFLFSSDLASQISLLWTLPTPAKGQGLSWRRGKPSARHTHQWGLIAREP